LLLAQHYAIEQIREANAFSWNLENAKDSQKTRRDSTHQDDFDEPNAKIVSFKDKNLNMTSVREIRRLSAQLNDHEKSNCSILLSESSQQFHWQRTDRDPLLSVRLKNDMSYNWSGGFKIDLLDQFYINLRNKFTLNQFLFLKVDIILDGGTFFIVFSDMVNIPAPIRIDNTSDNDIYFYQYDTKEDNYCTYVKAHKSIDYTWDELSKERKIVIGTRGQENQFLLSCLNMIFLNENQSNGT
jgi:hypothetical protein